MADLQPSPPPTDDERSFLPASLPPWRLSVKTFINHPAIDILVIVLILLSIALLVLEPLVAPSTLALCDILNHLITALFVIELTLRYLAERKSSHFFRKYWLDVIATCAPMFRSLRILRLFRLLRIFRLGKLLNRRFSGIQSRLTFIIAQHAWIFLIFFCIALIGALSLHMAEPSASRLGQITEALWFSVFTMIGGEPLTGEPVITASGRLITLFLMIAGLTTFASLSGIFSAIMISRLKPQMERGDMDIEELENHIVLCGWNRAANLTISVLQHSEEYKDRAIVLVAEFGEGEPDSLFDRNKVNPSNLHVIKGDFTRMDVLERAGVSRASEAIILADKCVPRSDQDRDARTILAAMLIEKIQPRIFTCIELLNRSNAAHLSTIGVEEALVTDEYAGTILANAQRTRGIIEILDELFNPTVGNQFYKISLPPSWIGLSIRTALARLKEEHDTLLVSLETHSHGHSQTLVNPHSDLLLKLGDKLVVIARKKPLLG